jgi:hypothetical protein
MSGPPAPGGASRIGKVAIGPIMVDLFMRGIMFP